MLIKSDRNLNRIIAKKYVYYVEVYEKYDCNQNVIIFFCMSIHTFQFNDYKLIAINVEPDP